MGKTGELKDLDAKILFDLVKAAGIPLRLQDNLKRTKSKNAAIKNKSWWYAFSWHSSLSHTYLLVKQGNESKIDLGIFNGKIWCRLYVEVAPGHDAVRLMERPIADPESLSEITWFIREGVYGQ